MSNINGHIKAPLFVERDYYDIPRAARMLGVEVEDICHWIDGGYIRLYAHVYDDFFNKDADHKPAAYSSVPITDVWDSNLDELTSWFRVLEVEETADGNLKVIHCNGVWLFSSLMFNGVDEFAQPLVEREESYVCLSGKTPIGESFTFWGVVNASSSHRLLLAASDVKRIYEALYLDYKLDKLFNTQSVEPNDCPVEDEFNKAIGRKPRTQVEHISLIDALIKSHPDIETELLNQPSKLHKALGELFARKAIHYPIKSAKTYSRWFKASKDK